MADYVKPLPVPEVETEPFWAACKEHRLDIQQCDGCGTFVFYPRAICPHCHSTSLTWRTSNGVGKVHTFSVVRQSAAPGFRDEVPYVVAVVEIDDAGGVQIMSNLVNVDPADVHIGMPVKVRFEDVTPEITLPKFEPA